MKGKNIVIIVVALLVLVSGTRFISNHLAKKEIENATMNYLTQQKRYNAKDIAHMYVVNVGGSETNYAAVVTFKNEPDVDYIYGFAKDSDEVIQLDIVNKGNKDNFKHKEISKGESLTLPFLQ